MSDKEIATGFVHWTATFGSLSKPVNGLADLADGIALFEICAEIDRQWFKSIRSADIGDNWVLKLNNLKKLYKLVTRYYDEVLGYPASNLSEPNLTAIAKSAEGGEVLKLAQLILTLAVQCERNQVYIGKIMSLGEDDQRSLMFSIESVLAQLGSAETEEAEAEADDVDMGGTADDDPVARLQAELMKSYAEKDELERSAHELTASHQQVQNRYEEVLEANEALKGRMEDLEKSMARADKSGKADYLLRAEIDGLKQALERAELRGQEAERSAADQTAAAADLRRRVAEGASAEEDAARLRDQLQEYKHAAERLAKSEHVIEKYKKKLEESADLRRHARQLEEQLTAAQTRATQLEDEFRRASQLRPAVDNYRDQYAQLESRHALATAELDQARDHLRRLEDGHERLRQDKLRDQDLIASLEESLRETELSGGGSAEPTQPSLAQAMDSDHLLAKVRSLERDLAEAKASSTDTAAGFLEEIADTATREKEEALKALRDREDEAARLRSELANANASLLASEQERDLARQALQRREGEGQSLEGWYAETHQQSTQFKKEVDHLSAENRRLAQELARANEQARLADAKPPRYSDGDVDRLQQELVKSRNEVHSLQLALKRTKDHCLQLDQKLRRADGPPQDDYREAMAALQAQAAAKDERIESLAATLREQNNTHMLESRTIASAWFNLQRQLERQSGFGHSSGMSASLWTCSCIHNPTHLYSGL